MCLANNETVPITQCGTDTIPFAEEKCNTQPCEDNAEQTTTEATMIEVCEDVEVDDDEEGDETPVEEMEQVAVTKKPVTSEKMEESSGSKDEMEAASGEDEMSENLLAVNNNNEMSAEGSGEAASESVIHFDSIQLY